MVSNLLLLFFGITSVLTSVCVIYMSRMIARLIKENSHLVAAMNSLFIEAVWPPPGEGLGEG